MEKESRSTVLIFFINGINSLLGWNAVLAALDYFAASFKEYNVYSFLPLPLFVAYLTVGLSYHVVSNKWKYSTIIVTGNMTVNVSMVCLFLTSIILDQTLIGFIISLFCSFFIGIGANLSQLTYFAMINYLSWEVVSKFTVGTAVSGLFMVLVRIILTLIFGTDDNSSFEPILIYFIIALAVNTADIFMNVRFCRSKVYKHKIDRYLLHHDKEKEPSDDADLLAEGSIIQSQEGNEEKPLAEAYVKEETRIENQNYFLTLKETCLSVMPYPATILFTFVVTFTIFPGPVFTKGFDSINGTWSVILFNLVYNIGDTAGKYAAELKGIFNHKSLLYLTIVRTLFIYPVTFMAMGSDAEDDLTNNVVFPYVNDLLFAITNGFCINASFILAFTVCPLKYKKYAGVLCGLALQIGIIVGTVIEIPYAYIFGINQ